MRVILMTGKGGVGKTSVAAATGLRCAELGYRTLVLSTDQLTPSQIVLTWSWGMTPTGLLPNLWGAGWMRSWNWKVTGSSQAHHPSLTGTWSGGIQAEELAIYRAWMKFWPGTHDHYDEGEFDVLIIDSAPLVLLCDC